MSAGTVGTVTRIAEHPRKPGHYVVDIDGREVAVVSAEALAAGKVAVGAAVDSAGIARLAAAGAELQTYDRAVNMLAARSRSSRDLRRRLILKGEPEPLVDRAIERLQRLGLLDDAAYARQVAHSKAVGQGASKRRVEQELFKRGVARGVADEAVAEVFAEEEVDESETALAVARKRLRSVASLDALSRRRRLYAFLARRGYSADAIRRALDTVLGAGEGRATRRDRRERRRGRA
jgi:regulatory protein